MKFIFSLIIIFPVSVLSQNMPDTFKIGSYVDVYAHDSMLIYFSCMGTVVEKENADFYRKGHIDKTNINFSGDFKDFYINGAIALEAKIVNNYLDGIATYYYESGNIKSKGSYKEDIKTGVWIYYYEDGNTKKAINYIRGFPYIVECYNKKGKPLVINGKGKYVGDFKTNKDCYQYSIWGGVKEGKMEGKWTWYNPHFKRIVAQEVFENGLFKRGKSYDLTYTDNSKIKIDGFCVNENLRLDKNILGYMDNRGFFYPMYKNKELYQSFYYELQNLLKTSLTGNLKNQWFIVGLTIDENSTVSLLNVKSSIDDNRSEKNIYNVIKSMSDFGAAKISDGYIDCNLFFTILIRDRQIIIPAEYLK